MRVRVGKGRGTVVAVALACLAAPACAQAKAFVVTRTDDPQPPPPCRAKSCTLRAAISAANASPDTNTVRLKGGATYRLSGSSDEDSNATGDLDVTGPAIIRPKGERAATIRAPRGCAGSS
jgi:hypothetical protein